MAICSFLGTEHIYDLDIYKKLQKAVDEIVQKNQEIEFWFYYHQNKGFFDLCLSVVWEARDHYPEKNITLATVVQNEAADNYIWELEQWETIVPPCVIDKVIAAPFFPEHPNKIDATAVSKKIERWIITQSTHVISYLYPGHFEIEHQYLELAIRCGIEIFDITNEETANFIIGNIDTLNEREQIILKNLLAGNTKTEIAKIVGVSSSAIQQVAAKAARKLQRKTENYAWKQKVENGDSEKISVCSIFALGEVTYETLSAFEQAVLFLIKKYHIAQFNILCEYCKTGYMSVLNSISKKSLISQLWKIEKLHLIAITHCPDINSMTREEWHNAASPYCPPCHAVENIDTHTEEHQEQVLRAIRGLIGQSNFCICHLSDNPFSDNIREYIAEEKKIKVLDISKKHAGTE